MSEKLETGFVGTEKIKAEAQAKALQDAVTNGVRKGIQGAFANFALAGAIVIGFARWRGWL